MPTLSGLQLPPLKNWQDFEILCCDLWQEIWNDPNTQRNGRQGQPQNGVDVFGRPQQGTKLAGIQCKGKDNFSDKHVTKDELEAEVTKAKKFRPAVEEFILATSGPKDVAVQEHARQITTRHRSGKFRVHVWGWDDIVEALLKYPNLVAKHYPEFALTETVTKGIGGLEEGQRRIVEESAKQHVDLKTHVSTEIHTIQKATYSVVLGPQQEAILEHARTLINGGKPAEGLRLLESQKPVIWSQAIEEVKAQLLTCMGAANLRLDNDSKAADLFIQAQQHDPDNEKVSGNCAIGYLLRREYGRAISIARTILEKNTGSAKAHMIIVHGSVDKSLVDVITDVPEVLRANEEVAFALGVAAQSRDEVEAAVRWFRIAHDNSMTPSPECKAMLAIALFRSVTQDSVSLTRLGYLTPLQRPLVEEVDRLLVEAWDALIEKESHSSRFIWLVNRAMARRFLGKGAKALEDLDTALSLHPGHGVACFVKASIATDEKNWDRALSAIADAKECEDVPFLPLFKIEVIWHRDGPESALKEIEGFLSTQPSEDLGRTARRLAVRAYLELHSYEKARTLSSEIRSESPDDIIDLIDAAQVEIEAGERDQGLAFLTKAKNCVSETSPGICLFLLGNAFYEARLFSDACQLYEQLSKGSADLRITRRLMHAYYFAGRRDRALELCQQVREIHGPLKDFVDVEVAICVDIGDLPKACETLEKYLSVFSDDARMRVRLATAKYRLGDMAAVDCYLNELPPHNDLSVEEVIQIANLLAARDKDQAATEWLYEVRRCRPNEGQIHLRYIQSVFLGSKDKVWLRADTVAQGTAVCVENVAGSRFWYIIDDRPDADPSRGELPLEHQMAQRLLGKKAADSVILVDRGTSGDEVKVVEVQSKFVRAAQESVTALETRFPEVDGFVVFRYPSGEEGAKLAVNDILKQVGDSQDSKQVALDLYLSGKITVGLLSELVGADPVDVWSGLTSGRSAQLRCCAGTADERSDAISRLDEKPKLIVDLTSLLTLQALGVSDLIVATFGRLGVSQSTLDCLTTTLHKREALDGGERRWLSKEGERLAFHEVSAEVVAEANNKLRSLIAWVRTSCDILPVTEALHFDETFVKERAKLIGEENIDSILLATQNDHCLFSDDLMLRLFARGEFGLKGVFTQALLMKCVDIGGITRATYNDAVIGLCRMGYHHASIDAHIMIRAAEIAGWQAGEPFELVCRRLADEECDDASAIIVAINFVYELIDKPILQIRQDSLVMMLLDNVTNGRNLRQITSTIRRALEHRLRLLPLALRNITLLINAWEMSRAT